jgi:hypothetical protein
VVSTSAVLTTVLLSREVSDPLFPPYDLRGVPLYDADTDDFIMSETVVTHMDKFGDNESLAISN